MAPVRLGAHALVSQGAVLCAGTHDVDDPNFQLITKPITIGNNAWVAAEAFIGPGVEVGDGTVVGARAVVAKGRLEPWGVYAGNPARFLRLRPKFDEARHDDHRYNINIQ
jgi:putative colanic acid biosynthesis acetyltransferase WcaF